MLASKFHTYAFRNDHVTYNMKRKRDVEGDHLHGRFTMPRNDRATKPKMSEMPVEPIRQFDRPACPNYKQPTEVGCFSLDIHRTVHLDRRGLRTYSPPDKSMGLDLSAGYNEYVEKEGREYLDHILTWITHNKRQFQRYTLIAGWHADICEVSNFRVQPPPVCILSVVQSVN